MFVAGSAMKTGLRSIAVSRPLQSAADWTQFTVIKSWYCDGEAANPAGCDRVSLVAPGAAGTNVLETRESPGVNVIVEGCMAPTVGVELLMITSTGPIPPRIIDAFNSESIQFKPAM